MSELHAIARLKIHHGKLEEFKRLAVKCMESVRTRDCSNTTGSSATTYRDSAALVEHGADLGDSIAALLHTCSISGRTVGLPAVTS